MLEHVTRSVDTDIYIAAALNLGLEVDVINKTQSYVRIAHGGRNLLVNTNALSVTSTVHRRMVYDKTLTHRLFARAGVPYPEAILIPIAREDDILDYWREHRPVVIKPNTGSLSQGVCVDPRSEAEVLAAVQRIKDMGRNYVLIERFVPGDNFRIVLYREHLVGLIRWVPPYVVGDGIRPLGELIAAKAEYRRLNRGTPVQVQPEVIEAQGHSLETVLPRGNVCRLNASSSHTIGGDSVRVDPAAVHPDNMALFVAAVRATYLDLCGIDFISTDIGVSHLHNQAGINEVNACPNIDCLYFADDGESTREVETLLKLHFDLPL